MYYYTYSPVPPAPVRQRQKHMPKRLFVAFGIVVVVTLVAFHLWSQSVKAIDTHPQLAKELADIIKANPSVTIGVALIDLDDNDTAFTYGQTTASTAASTTKVLTAAAFLDGVEQGKYSLGMPLGIGAAR